MIAFNNAAYLEGTGYVDTNGDWQLASAATPIPVTVTSGGGLPSSIVTGQVKIAVTGTAVRFPSNALVNGVIITSHSANLANLVLGGVGITNTLDGTGNGTELAIGGSLSAAVSNTNILYINGTAGDWVGFIGS